MDRAEAIQHIERALAVPNRLEGLALIDRETLEIALQSLQDQTHDKRTDTHGVCLDLINRAEPKEHGLFSDIDDWAKRKVEEMTEPQEANSIITPTDSEDCISRADIEYHTQLEARGNGQYEEVEVAYKHDIDNLPPVTPIKKQGVAEPVATTWFVTDRPLDITNATDSHFVATDSDCISRADTVNALCRECQSETKCGGADCHENWCAEVAVVMGMPPVNQKQVTGKLENAENATSDGEESTMDQPKSKLDCISRQQAVEAVTNTIREKFSLADWYEQLVETGLEIENLIKELPPITPTERTGEWVEDDEEYTLYTKCSECGYWADMTRYCPNCGAKMGGDVDV